MKQKNRTDNNVLTPSVKVLKTGVTTHHDVRNACSLKLQILLHPRTC